MTLRKYGSVVADYVLPKRKTFVRSLLFSLLGLLPFLLGALIRFPHLILPFLLLVGYVAHLCGLSEDVLKQLRWMRRMSGQGPIFWAIARTKRTLVRFSRWRYGDGCDVQPHDIPALGTSTRGAESATIKWIAPPMSDFSSQAYDVELRLADNEAPRIEEVVAEGGAGDGEAQPADWMTLIQGHAETELCLKPLVPGRGYDVRVRARNSKGCSAWRVHRLTTKQKPLLLEESAGGEGEGYRWLQSLKDDSIHMTVFGLPPLTKSRNLEVSLRPAGLKVSLLPSKQVVLEGELYAPIVPDDCLWELKDAPDAESRELHVTLLKHAPRQAGDKEAPLWPQLLKGHPEVDMSKVKRQEKSLEDIMAELHQADPDGMNKVQQLKKDL